MPETSTGSASSPRLRGSSGLGASTTTVSAHTAHSATRCRSERPLEEGDGAGLALVREDLV
jgi:hypothetical protein